MYDNTLKVKSLPSELIVKNFIEGVKQCNYELYLLELINKSSYFLELSKGILYTAPSSESNGECDCISDNYQMDFKLIGGTTLLHAKSILFDKKRVIDNSVIITGPPKGTNKKMETTFIPAALRNYNYQQLCKLRCQVSKQTIIEKDIYQLLKLMEKKKNLLLFFPYYFFFDNSHELMDGVRQIMEVLDRDFNCLMQYRLNVTRGYDTYLCFLYDGYIVFMKYDNSFIFVDHVDVNESPIFKELSDIASN